MRLSAGEIFLLDDHQLNLRAARGVSVGFLRSDDSIPLGQCECGKCALTGELVATQDLQNLPGFSHTACLREGFDTLVSVPVQTAERVMGVIHLASAARREFDSEDRALLTSIGHLVGNAVEKAQLHAQLGILNQELEARVAQRTTELEQAKEELAEKAQVLTQVLTAERQVEEKTRAQIAGDLHDGVQQLIVGALYEIQSARDASPENRQAIPARLSSAQDLLRRIETEMRSVIQSLHPVALDAQGLAPALRECVTRFERVSRIRCELKIAGIPQRYASEVEVAAFRIAQEALHNAEAHAHARHVCVELDFRSETLTLQVSDDGTGFDARTIQSEARAHLGLIGMRERAASVGGTLEIESRVGTGTRVMLNVPIKESAARAEPLAA
jgi:signal transduction histidine kinase